MSAAGEGKSPPRTDSGRGIHWLLILIGLLLAALVGYSTLVLVKTIRWPITADSLDAAGLASALAGGVGALVLALITFELVKATKGLENATRILADQQRRDLDRRGPFVVVKDALVISEDDRSILQLTLENQGEAPTSVTSVKALEFVAEYSTGPDGESEFEGPGPGGEVQVVAAALKKRGQPDSLRIGRGETAAFTAPMDFGDTRNTLFFEVEVNFAEGPVARASATAIQAPSKDEGQA